MRIGTGYDLHRLVAGRALILAAFAIPFERGLHGHSDADIVCHAVTDAILGAAAAGDIGRLFPDTDRAWKDADSLELLRRAVERVRAARASTSSTSTSPSSPSARSCCRTSTRCAPTSPRRSASTCRP